MLVSDNVLQDGDVARSRYAIERRDRTIHKRMRDYLYTIKNHPQLETTILPVGDGVAISIRMEKATRDVELLIPASNLEVLKVAVLYGADAVYIGGESVWTYEPKAKNFSIGRDVKEGVEFAHKHGRESVCHSQYRGTQRVILNRLSRKYFE